MRLRLAAIPATIGVLVLAFASVQAPALGAGTPQFLTLPFAAGQKIVIQRAWWTRGNTGAFDLLHHAVDYVFGTRDVIPSWKPFDVLAAAAGEACGAKVGQTGCFNKVGERMGNRVLIKHSINGVIYYTFYNHLATMASDIPLNNVNKTVHVDAGQKIGVAGASNSLGLLHLHWELLDAHLKPLDPYGIYGITDQYPDPKGKNGKLAGAKNFFLTNPPAAYGAAPKPTPKPTSSPGITPEPGASPTPAGTDTTLPTDTPGSSAPGVTSPPADQTPAATGSATASPGPVVPGSSADSGLGIVPIAVGVGAVIAGVVLIGLLLLSRRRKAPLPRDSNWRP